MTQDLLKADDDQPQFDENKNYLEELVGDGKKFKSAEDLAKGKAYADQTIELYKRRLDELREDYLKVREENVSRAKLEELIDKLSTPQHASNEQPDVKDEPPRFDPKDIETLVNQKIVENETIKMQTENFNTVQAKLKQQLGDNYASVVRQRSAELGLSAEDVNSLAKKSPKAFFNTLGLDQQEQRDTFVTPPRSNQRSDNFSPKGAAKRTWAYYQEMKKANPQLYYDPKIAVQMQQDAIEQGDAFRDGNYYVKGLHEPN